MRDKTAQKVIGQKSRRDAALRGSAGRREHKGKANTSNKGSGGKMAR
jgi:hypothetical protein